MPWVYYPLAFGFICGWIPYLLKKDVRVCNLQLQVLFRGQGTVVTQFSQLPPVLEASFNRFDTGDFLRPEQTLQEVIFVTNGIG